MMASGLRRRAPWQETCATIASCGSATKCVARRSRRRKRGVGSRKHCVGETMRATRTAGITAVLGMLHALVAHPAGGDAEAGRRNTVTCNACHGQASLKSVPNLGGQSETYFVSSMHAYQDGRRGHATMRDVAKAWSDRELKNFAAHYARFGKGEAEGAPPVEKPASAAPCEVCHGGEGRQPVNPESAVLAGQKAPYLKAALREYRDGARTNAVMQATAAGLTDDEIEALSDYFSRLTGLEGK
jgi:cytochrome c553